MIAARKHWRRLLTRVAGAFVFLLLSVSTGQAQAAITCPAFVEQALNAVSQTCASIGRNQVCYGNSAVDTQFNASAQVSFAQPGDHASVLELERLTTAPLLPDENIWGVAVMAIQANLPDSLPGENATFILFGDTEVTPADAPADYNAPMQAFNLETRISGIACAEVPESGMLVQAPEETTVNFLINGVEVKVGSSALLQVDDGEMTIDTIEGFVEVTSGGATEVVGEGLTTRVRQGQRPLRAAITRATRVLNAPWRLLPRQVRAMPPAPDGQIIDLNECFYLNPQRAAQNPVSARAGEAIVLRFSVPHNSLELARIIQRQTRSQLSINGVFTPAYTRIGPWRGASGEYGVNFDIDFYWLFPAPPAGEYRVVLESESLSGRPIQTGVDGPDPDSEPEVIPAQRRIFCLVQVVSG
ncbi:MAG: hypothetical protein ABI835_12250 [Chloroflexota bacterium]